MSKIKISQKQLNVLMEQHVTKDFHMDQNGDMQVGEVTGPEDPYELAEKVADEMEIHRDYLQDEEKYRIFVDALHEVLISRLETGESLANKNDNPLIITPEQFNESKEDILKNFNRYL